MIKRKIDSYIRSYYQNNRNALLITGARQVGKSYSIREFGKTFGSFIEINFVESPEAIEALRTAKTVQEILLRISVLTHHPLIEGDTLIFFDEVQLCPEIVTAIKFLVDEGSYRYILSGSLLGVALQDLRSEPVGYMGVKEMYPMDLEEFVRAVGVQDRVMDALRDAWEHLSSVDDTVHRTMMELFRLYLVVGGMPAVVKKYIETNNLQEVLNIQQEIITLYRRDIAQYAHQDKLLIEDIFDLIPPELNAKNKRFVLKSLNQQARYQRYENSFLWLARAGVALPIYNVDEPKIPMILSRSRNLFKLFQNDVGLLAAQYAQGIQLQLISGDKAINYGAIYENVVAQELIAHGYTPYYYNNKKRGEIDFLIEEGGQVVPIEVKSGKDYEVHRALANILDVAEYAIGRAIVLCNDNLRLQGKMLYAPIYMLMFIERKADAPTHYRVDLSAIQ